MNSEQTMLSRTGQFGNSAVIRKQAVVEPKQKGRIERTSAGLREALFDAIEKVRDGDMLPEDAKAISGLAAQVCNSVQLEIQVAKLRTEYPSDTKLVLPGTLQLGAPAEEKKEK